MVDHVEEPSIYPYSMEVGLSPNSTHSYQWMIRKKGMLVERSDRLYLTEAAAHAKASSAVERLLGDYER